MDLFKNLRLTLSFLAVMIFPHHAMANLLSCPRMTHDEAITRYQNVTEALGSTVWRGDIQADVFNRFGQAPGYIENEEDRMMVIHEFLLLIEKEIVTAAIKSTVETLYYVYEPRELTNSFYKLAPDKIPNRILGLLCQSACQTIPRDELVELAQGFVKELLDKRVPRFNFEEITEQINTNFEGLNSILNYRDQERNIDLGSYREHYDVLKSSFPGFLIKTDSLKRYYEGPFTLDDYDLREREFINPTHKTSIPSWKVKRAFREHLENIRQNWAKFNHESLFKFRWYDKLNIYGVLNILEKRDNYDEIPPYYERLLLLSKYMASAPMAVANALNKQPSLYQNLCWIIEDLDRVTSSWYIQSSVSNLNAYLMPLTIGVLVFMAPFSAPAFVAGLIFLNVVTGIDLAKRKAEADELQRELNFHERIQGTELETHHTREFTSNLEATIAKERWMMGVILALEVASIGVAKGFGTYAKKVAESMSESQAVSKLMRPYLYRSNPSSSVRGMRKNHRLIHARVETDRFINKVISKNGRAYDKALTEYPGSLTSNFDVKLFQLSFAINRANKKDAMKLLISSKNTGFGIAGLNVELATEAIEQIIVHLNTPVMTDYTAINIVKRILLSDY